MGIDKNNPLEAQEIYNNLSERFGALIDSGRIKLRIIPDIESVNYGRDVGYEIIEHSPPEEVKKISGTKIRNKGEHSNWENEGGSNLGSLPEEGCEGGHY